MTLFDVRIRATQAGIRRLLVILLALELALFLLYGVIRATDDMVGGWGVLDAFFDLDAEQSVPAWFSSLQLFVVGALFLIAARERDALRPALARLLRLLGLGFLFLSLDEAASLHEQFDFNAESPSIAWLTRLGFAGGRGVWIAAYALIAAVALPFFLYFALPGLREMWRRHRRESLWIVAGVVAMFAGGVVFEAIGHLFLRGPETPAFYALEVGMEELFEMAGCTLVLCGALLLASSEARTEEHAREAVVAPGARA